MSLPSELQPTPLEIACGAAFGWSPADPLPATPPSLTPLTALEEALLPSLEATGCFVAFSGGRDSSTMLAVAVHAARRRGLPDPVPLTLRFPAAAGTDESGWQEEVVAHLGLRDWVRIELGDELDMLGPIARGWLERHRCPWPANGHSFAPLYAAARGGSLVTGIDGDGLLDSWRWARVRAVLGARARPVPRDALRIAAVCAPRTVREAVARRRDRPFDALPWLTPRAKRALTEKWAAYRAAEPGSWRARLQWYPGQRHLRALCALVDAEAAAHGARAVHPLLDRRFLGAFARAGGRTGYADRAAAIRALLGDLLPEGIVTRRTKADFTWAFWGPESRAFAESWSGEGAPEDLVDADALRAAWLAPKPDVRSASQLQAAWLASTVEREQ